MGKINKDKKKTKPLQITAAPSNPFEEAVKLCPDIANGFKKGLSALKKGETSKIKPKDPELLNGSVDIDKEISTLYPNDARWDYVIGYNNFAYFVEIHPAYTSQIQSVLNKKAWLENWLTTRAKELNNIKHSIHWIFTEKYAILPTSSQYKKLAQEGLMPVRELKLE